MTIDRPLPRQIPGLRRLWQRVFGDTDSWLDAFFAIGFSPERCRCVTCGEEPVSVLYWFDALLDGRKLAYLYAIATAPEHRGRGLCRRLTEDTHRHLAALGYDGTILVPAEPSLFAFYGRMGYRTVSTLREFISQAGETPEALEPLSPEVYARLRQQLAPEGTVLQEGAALAFFAAQGAFYRGDGLLLAVQPGDGHAFIPEFLGDADKVPGVLKTLGAKTGTVRTPGREKPFAMGLSFTEEPLPNVHFAFALD